MQRNFGIKYISGIIYFQCFCTTCQILVINSTSKISFLKYTSLNGHESPKITKIVGCLFCALKSPDIKVLHLSVCMGNKTRKLQRVIKDQLCAIKQLKHHRTQTAHKTIQERKNHNTYSFLNKGRFKTAHRRQIGISKYCRSITPSKSFYYDSLQFYFCQLVL